MVGNNWRHFVAEKVVNILESVVVEEMVASNLTMVAGAKIEDIPVVWIAVSAVNKPGIDSD